MLEQSIKQNNLLGRRNIIFAVAIIVVVAIYYLITGGGSAPVTLEFDENSMILTHPSNASVSVEIAYQDILSINEVSGIDIGQKIHGIEDDQCLFGTWENKDFGQYTLCVSLKNNHYIVLYTTNNVVVFNYGDSVTTQELYSAMLELIPKES